MKELEGTSVAAGGAGNFESAGRIDLAIQRLVDCPDVVLLSTAHAKMQKLMDDKASLNTLHVIADFDMTLTKHWVPARRDFHDLASEATTDGQLERNLSSHGVLERGEHVSKDFAIHTRQLYKHYYPMEISTSLGKDEKTKLMIEWWTKAHEAMIAEGFTREGIEQQAREAAMQFRDGVRELIDFLDTKQVPLLIFSAGIGDVIEALLRVNDLHRPTQRVVSNKMRFSDEDGRNNASEAKLIGFREPLVHSLNKGESAVQAHSSLAEQIHARRKVILLGDSPGDAHMAAGAEHEVVLKIGFFNFGDETRRKEFEQVFDILVLKDSSMDPVLHLLRRIETE